MPILFTFPFGGSLVLLLLLGLLTNVLPQMPGYIQDSVEAQNWLLRTAQSYPGGFWLASLGLFNITRGLFFRLLLLLVSVLATVQVGYILYLRLWPWRQAEVPPLSPQAAEGGRVEQVARPFGDTWERMEHHLLTRGLVAVTLVKEEEEVRFFARQGLYGAWSSLSFFLGTLLVMTSIYWGLVMGWQTPPVILAPNQSWDVGHNTGLRVDLRSAGVRGAQGPTSLFFFQRQDGPSTVRAVPVGGGVRVGDIHLTHTDLPLGLSVRATDRADIAVPLQTPSGRVGRQVTLLFPQPGAERVVLVPSYGLEVRIVGYTSLPERGYEGPVFLVQVTSQEEEVPVYSEFVSGDTEVALARLTLGLEVVHHATIYATHYPGRFGRVLGALLIVVGGLALVTLGPLQRLWVQVFGTERITIVRAWGDAYNVGWHRSLSGERIQAWLEERNDGEAS